MLPPVPSYVVLLRAAHAAGRDAPAEAIRDALTDAGLGEDVRTYGRDGNVRLRTRMRKPERVAAAIEAALRDALGKPVDALVRTVEEFAAVHRFGASLENPVAGDVRRHVVFLRQAPPTDVARIVASWDVPGEAVVPHGRELYLWSRLPLRSAVIPAQLRSAPLEASTGALTIRSWKVVGDLFGRWVDGGPSARPRHPRSPG